MNVDAPIYGTTGKVVRKFLAIASPSVQRFFSLCRKMRKALRYSASAGA
ncbi:hypothetical protein PLANPX_5402 [Lacipirellula parvula]|uniref:Uncharacterized protein n=1 Tax=Lacipirellula parvula TaxID=2650471 RepID=A0A5K7XG41_9BACT|nr:hypothetical protein PLANPX_5402 [Lacipirellula parvula]